MKNSLRSVVETFQAKSNFVIYFTLKAVSRLLFSTFDSRYALMGVFSGLLIVLSLAEPPHFAFAQSRVLNPEAVRLSIRRGSDYLKGKQKPDGSWPTYRYAGDTTALCTLALLNSLDDPTDPAIQKGIRYLLTIPREEQLQNYVLSLRIMVLATADPKGEIYRRELAADVEYLLGNQLTKAHDDRVGGWAYVRGSNPHQLADASNSQFALLALHEAAQVGIKIPRQNWELARQYWLACLHKPSGAFQYRPGDGQLRGSMVCAGISSWIIIEENLADPKAEFNGDFAICCREIPDMSIVENAIQWLVDRYTVKFNPVATGHGSERNNWLYYLYGMERVGRLSGRRFFGPHDWYRDGAKELLARNSGFLDGHWHTDGGHGEDNYLVGTSLALLFLSKGKRAVAIGKYKYSEDQRWDRHPGGVHYLTGRLEREWNQKLNWQTVSGVNATVDDLLEAPVLFISGKDRLALDPQQKFNLKTYLENGGFLFAEGCQGEGCGDGEFDKAFRELMAELFPESQLEALEATHPVWNAHFPLLPNAERPLLGLRACCRTSVIYCPTNLSCYWALEKPAVREVAGQGLSRRIEYCAQLGVNVVTYATGRMLKDKGEAPTLAEKNHQVLQHRVLEFAKLSHTGGADEAPNALRILLRDLQALGLRINLEKKLISATDENLFDFPFVFIHGRTGFRFTDQERAALKAYLENGGMMVADAICSSKPFADAFRNEILAITDQRLAPLDKDHEIWGELYGERIDQVTVRTRNPTKPGGFESTTGSPRLEGIEINGRLAVVLSPYDISCALENSTFSQCDGHTHEDAVRIGKKLIFYSLLADRAR